MFCEDCLQEITIGYDGYEHCGCEVDCPCGCGDDPDSCVYRGWGDDVHPISMEICFYMFAVSENNFSSILSKMFSFWQQQVSTALYTEDFSFFNRYLNVDNFLSEVCNDK